MYELKLTLKLILSKYMHGTTDIHDCIEEIIEALEEYLQSQKLKK